MKPRLLVGGLTDSVYVVTRYKEHPGGLIEATRKHDVTADFWAAAKQLGLVTDADPVTPIRPEEG